MKTLNFSIALSLALLAQIAYADPADSTSAGMLTGVSQRQAALGSGSGGNVYTVLPTKALVGLMQPIDAGHPLTNNSGAAIIVQSMPLNSGNGCWTYAAGGLFGNPLIIPNGSTWWIGCNGPAAMSIQAYSSTATLANVGAGNLTLQGSLISSNYLYTDGYCQIWYQNSYNVVNLLGQAVGTTSSNVVTGTDMACYCSMNGCG